MLPVMALTLGAAATVVTFVLAGASVRHSDELLLRQDAVQGSLVLGSYIGQTPPAVVELAQDIPASGFEASTWDADASAVAKENGYSSLAVVRSVGHHFVLVTSTGTIHRAFGTGADLEVVSALNKGESSYVGATSEGRKRWLTQFLKAPSAPSLALYIEESVSLSPISLNSLPGHPFSGIEGAVYAGREVPADLVYSSTNHLPLTGERAVGVIDGANPYDSKPAQLSAHVGSMSAPGSFILVIRATGNLSGNWSNLLPWMLLFVGAAFTLSVAALLEVSDRRRGRALLAMHQLKERNVDLDRAIDLQKETAARFAAMVRSSSDLTTVISASGEIRYQSPSSATMLGMEPDTMLGTSFPALVHPDDEPQWSTALAESEMLPGTEITAEWRLRTSDGAYVAVDARVTNLLANPAVAGIILNSRDVTDGKRLEDELRHQAFHDSMTGLANRALFEDRLENALARLTRTQSAIGILFLDLDDFKAVNDGRGHKVGDELLRAVSDRLRGIVRAGDTLARIGGDEFAVLVEGGEASGAHETAERILEALRRPFTIGAGEASVRASVGVAVTDGRSHGAQELLRDADIAMYAAKNAGKGRIEMFHPGLHDQVISRLQLEVDLGQALENGELSVHYQPVVDVANNEVVGVEALMRWAHRQRGVVMPGEFIPIAESTGLIVPMGKWLLERACQDARTIHEATGQRDLHLAVNLSARQLDDPHLVRDVQSALSSSTLEPGLLTLEITESVFMANRDRSLDVLEQLRALGVKLSIDDFGTGYSSLGYLQRLPVDELKIDRSFVASASARDGDEHGTLIRTIVRLAHDFGLGTVAEGIETREQLTCVREAGCELAQGYLFARPVELSEVTQIIRELAQGVTQPAVVFS